MNNIRPQDLYEIRGDFSDPTGTGKKGVAAGLNLETSSIGRPKVVYRGAVDTRLTEPDVYLAEDGYTVLLFCPRCGNTLRITSQHKRIDYTRGYDGGRISIEDFRCTWDGCGLHVRIKDNVMVDL